MFPSSQAPMVLSQPWLTRDNPHIDWSTSKVVSWGSFFHFTCLQSALAPVQVVGAPPVTKTPDLSSVPPIYHALREVFSKQNALSLPHIVPNDYAIDLLP